MGRASCARAGPKLADRGERLRDSREGHGGLVQPLCIFRIELEAGVQVVSQPIGLVLHYRVDVEELFLAVRFLRLGLLSHFLIGDVDFLAPPAPKGAPDKPAREWRARPKGDSASATQEQGPMPACSEARVSVGTLQRAGTGSSFPQVYVLVEPEGHPADVRQWEAVSR